ncbi:MAG: AbrB/MazE/SpoVT family DNA-binding domain-containing protein [Intestinimonas sp.]|jgi:antitoxin MazE|nr:AbrB/MazE/SpoVT family DNA-binding domain-containing protein [Intestinimonas sp.]
MFATIQKWGNSQGLRIPKALLDGLGICENDRVELIQTSDAITIKKAAAAAHRTLEERLIAFYGKPIEEIDRIQGDGEIDWGKPEGQEQW